MTAEKRLHTYRVSPALIERRYRKPSDSFEARFRHGDAAASPRNVAQASRLPSLGGRRNACALFLWVARSSPNESAPALSPWRGELATHNLRKSTEVGSALRADLVGLKLALSTLSPPPKAKGGSESRPYL